MSKGTILLVEDNPEIQKANTFMLAQRHYTVICVETVSEARKAIQHTLPDLIVLDIMLPDGSGLSFCKEIRQRSQVPILFLTALGESDDMVQGLRQGGDDYLAKPYEYEVLLARIEALLRRSSQHQFTLEREQLKLEVSAMRAYVDGRDALLTQKEFLLLLTLMQREGETVTAEELYRSAWGDDANEDTRAVRPQISRLRSKLALGSNTQFSITAKYGQGYVFCMSKES